MRRKLATTFIALALALLPCAKVAYAWVAPNEASASEAVAGPAAAQVDFGYEDTTPDQICIKCCSTAKGTVHRSEPLPAPQVSKYLPVLAWFEQPEGPHAATDVSLLRARAPPPLTAASAFKAVFAKTSRVLN